MANDFRETRDLAGESAELFAAALQAAVRCRWKVKQTEAATFTARTPWMSLRGGGERVEVRVGEQGVTCDSRSWSKLNVSDLGKNRANVGRFFDALADVRGGQTPASPVERMRSFTETLRDRVTEDPSGWAPPPSPVGPDEVVVHDIRFADPVVELVSLDEIPVDNSKGKTELAIETEVRYTLRAGVSIGDTRSVGGELGLSAAKILTAKINAEGSRSRNVTEGQEITKSYKATFRAGPGENMVYRIEWKRRTFPGEIEFTEGPGTQSVPFQLVADLEYAVSTQLAET